MPSCIYGGIWSFFGEYLLLLRLRQFYPLDGCRLLKFNIRAEFHIPVGSDQIGSFVILLIQKVVEFDVVFAILQFLAQLQVDADMGRQGEVTTPTKMEWILPEYKSCSIIRRPSTTLAYIGITKEELDAVYITLNLDLKL